MKITCKKCNITWPNLAEYMNRSCTNKECVLLQPEVTQVPKKPQHINASLLLPTPKEAGTPKIVSPRQVKMRMLKREVDVVSNYTNSIADCRYVDVPQIICINLYPRGK